MFSIFSAQNLSLSTKFYINNCMKVYTYTSFASKNFYKSNLLV